MHSSSEDALSRLGVLGGTFDPLHIGHLIVASEALFAFELDRILFVPAGRPWQKPSYSSAEDRFMMTSLGVGSHPKFAVSRIELDRSGLTYTVDTLTALRDFHGPELRLYFIVGADALMNLATWEGIERLAGLTELIAVSRPGFDVEDWQPQPEWPKVRMLPVPGIDVSATDIRARVATGRPIDYLVPPEVARYIREHGLYLGAQEAAGA
jgi:nicotinate-nucleotide adenylyltransferase